MRKLLYLLPLVVLISCTRDSFEPMKEDATFYYLLIRAEVEEDLSSLKREAIACIRPYGNYRITNVYLGKEFEQPLLVVRKFESEREGKRVVKALRKEPMFRKRETRIVSQVDYREILKQRTFYAVY